MAMSCRYAAQSCARQLRCARSTRAPTQMLRMSATQRRYNSTDAPANPKVAEIVDQISQLTLLETADLVSSLKSKLNIPDMPMGGFAAPAAPAAAEEAEDDAPAAPAEKTLFTLKLQGIDATSKAKVIKEVKALLGLSLVDSKKFVESAPKTMKENVPKEDAEKIINTMKEIGATVVMD